MFSRQSFDLSRNVPWKNLNLNCKVLMIEKPTWSIMRRTKWTNLTGICLNSHPPGWTQNTDLTNLNVTSERKTMDTGTRLGPAPLQGCAMHSSLLLRLQAENEQVPLCNSGHLNVFYETPRYEEYLSWSSTFSTVKKDLIALLFPGSRWACRFSWRQTSYL